MKVDSSIRSLAWKYLALLAIVAINGCDNAKSPTRLFRSFFRSKSGIALTLGVDEEALRESVRAEIYDANDTAVVDARVSEALRNCDERVIEVIRRRLDGMDLDVVAVECLRGHRFCLRLPEMDEATRIRAKQSLERVGYLEFRLTHPRNQKLASDLLGTDMVPEGYAPSARGDGYVRVGNYEEVVKRPGYKTRLSSFGRPPQGYVLMLEKDKDSTYRPNFVSRKTELTGESIVSANVDRDEIGRPVVAFKLNAKGGNLMRKLTRNYIAHGERNSTDRGRELAIILDGELISAPVLQSEISTRGQISGHFYVAEAKRLANDLNSGALPVPLKILAEETWGDRQ